MRAAGRQTGTHKFSFRADSAAVSARQRVAEGGGRFPGSRCSPRCRLPELGGAQALRFASLRSAPRLPLGPEGAVPEPRGEAGERHAQPRGPNPPLCGTRRSGPSLTLRFRSCFVRMGPFREASNLQDPFTASPYSIFLLSFRRNQLPFIPLPFPPPQTPPLFFFLFPPQVRGA